MTADPDSVRDQLLHALDFAYCNNIGYTEPEQLLAAYDASRSTPPPAPAGQTERRTRYASAMARRDGDTWPTTYEEDEADYLRRADAVMAVADAEQAEYAAENTTLHQWHDEDRTALAEMRATIERLRTTAQDHRLALSEALGLGTGAPWDAIRDRTAELQAAPVNGIDWKAKYEAEHARHFAVVQSLVADPAALLRGAADDLEAWEPEPSERWTEAERNRYEDGVDAAADYLRRRAAELRDAEEAPREHCTHRADVHAQFHHAPVDGCIWCHPPGPIRRETGRGMDVVPLPGDEQAGEVR